MGKESCYLERSLTKELEVI